MARRTRKESLETRAKLLESALDIMSRKPFPSVTMTEIAENVNLSKGALYWLFENKKDVVVNVILHFCTLMGHDFNISLDPNDPLESLRVYFRKKVELSINDSRLNKIYKIMLYRYGWPSEVQEQVYTIISKFMEEERQNVENMLAAAQDCGKFRSDFSPKDASYAITSAMYGVFMIKIGNLIKCDFEAQIDFIFSAFEKELSKPEKLFTE